MLRHCPCDHATQGVYNLRQRLTVLYSYKIGKSSPTCAHSSSPAPAVTHQREQQQALLRQSQDSWQVLTQEDPLPRLLLIDGTNLACLCAGSKHTRHSTLRQPVAARFKAWLKFLQAATAADAVLLAFDNKGSAEANVRAQLAPKYLQKRYKSKTGSSQTAAAATPRAALDGWGHLAAAAKDLPGCFVAHATYGFEADDVLAAAAQWAASCLRPQPLVLLASSDSDMQQLLDPHTYWLQLLQVVSAQHPSGLLLHSAAAFEAHHGFPPSAYPAYLSLVGKPEASVTGVGTSARLARTLLARFRSLDAVLSAGESGGLKAFGSADKLLGGSGGAAAAANRQAAAANMAVLQLYPQRQVLPEQQLKSYWEALLQTKQQQQQQDCSVVQQQQQPQWQQQQQQQQQLQPLGQQQPQRQQLLPPPPQQQQQRRRELSVADVAALHPARQAHLQQCGSYLYQLSSCLAAMGITQHKVGWLSPVGWCDMVIRLPGTLVPSRNTNMSSSSLHGALRSVGGGSSINSGGISSSNSNSGGISSSTSTSNLAADLADGPTDFHPKPHSDEWLVVQVLGPADLINGPTPPGTCFSANTGFFRDSTSAQGRHHNRSSYECAVDSLARHLGSSCGCYVAGTSPLGRPKRRLLACASGAAKRQLSLLKAAGWRVAVVPFYELHLASTADSSLLSGAGAVGAAGKAAVIYQAGSDNNSSGAGMYGEGQHLLDEWALVDCLERCGEGDSGSSSSSSNIGRRLVECYVAAVLRELVGAAF